MRSFRKSDDILGEWRAVADRATPPARAPRGSSHESRLPALAVTMAILVLVAAILVPRAIAPNVPAVSSSPFGTAPTTSSAETASVAPTPAVTATPALTATDTTLTTAGATGAWQGFDWTPVPDTSPLLGAAEDHKVISWAHGYAMTQTIGDTPPSRLWTSPDGVTWTLGPLRGSPLLVADGPAGLLAVGFSVSGTVAQQIVSTSQDGTTWTETASPQGLRLVRSIAGNHSGYVAVVSDQASTETSIVFSTDGVHWSPVTVHAGLLWDSAGPTVQAANGRLFLMGGLAPGSGLGPDRVILASSVSNGQVWWSDDGRTWIRSTGLAGYGSYIDATAGALLLHTEDKGIPGGTGFAWSRDGGKTWQDDQTFGPLGQLTCQSECGVGPDGSIGSNGLIFLAVKSDGHAWTSTDGTNWKAIAWGGGSVSMMVVLPRGVLVYPALPVDVNAPAAMYGAAR
jgi:hypothetical protein